MRARTTPIVVLMAGAFLTPAPAQISAVEENGRKIYVDAAPLPVSKAKPRRSSVLVYWSRQQRRWVAVPPPTPSAMRAARYAAADVRRYLSSVPAAEAQLQGDASPDNREIIGRRAITSAELDKIIADAASRHAVDANLVRAIIKVESNFNPAAVSRKGAMGLMQLMPATARGLNVANPFDPQQNVDAGVRHLKGLLDNYGGNVELAAAAYNAGGGAVQRHGGVPPYRETRDYVRKVKGLYNGNGTVSGTSAPIRVYRNENGTLTFSNTD